MIKLKNQFLSFFLFNCIVNILIGQQRQEFNGDLNLNSFSGVGNYQYVISQQDTLYDGSFIFQNSNLEALIEKKDSSFVFKGNFNLGVPNGEWKFQFGEFTSSKQSKLVDNEYRVLINGIQDEAIGKLTNGKPNGAWSYITNEIDASKIKKTLFKSSFIFDNGIPQQNFQIENEAYTLVGRVLRTGIAHDEWSLYTTNNIDDNESWFFKDGVLEKIRFNIKNETKDVLIFSDNESQNFKTIRLDQNYLKLLNITANLKGTSLSSKSGIHSLLDKNEKHYQKLSSIFNSLGSKNFLPQLKVKVPYYSIENNEVKLLEQITSDYRVSDAIRNKLLNNSHLNIVKRSDSDVNFKYELIKVISTDFLAPLEQIVHLKNTETIAYVDLDSFIKTLWSNGMPSKEITVTDSLNANQSFSLPNKVAYNFSGNNLNALAQLGEYVKLSLQQIQESLADRLTNEERLQMLNALEKDLITSNNVLKELIKESIDNLPKKHQNSLQKIQALAEQSLKAYALIENPEEKFSYGKARKTCLSQLTALANTIINLSDKTKEITALYTDAIWNPFMATVMNEEVKKRITTAYTKTLIPHFITEINTSLSCENAVTLSNQITHTNSRMVELREEDTKKLERKLRKEKDPREIMKLLHQQSSIKNKK